MEDIRNLLRINTNIKVTRAAGEEDWYSSTVQDIGTGTLSIAVPTQGPNPLVLGRGEKVRVTFVNQMSRYEFTTTVVGWRHDNIPLYELLIPSELKRIQLREFVRVPVMMDVDYAVDAGEGERPSYKKCTALDISGGGMRLLTKKEIPAGTGLFLRFVLPLKTGPETMELKGKVVRSWSDPETKNYQCGVQFLGISRRQQDLIVRFVLFKLSEQRRLT